MPKRNLVLFLTRRAREIFSNEANEDKLYKIIIDLLKNGYSEKFTD